MRAINENENGPTRNIYIENVGSDNPGELGHVILTSLFKPCKVDPATSLTFRPGQVIRLKLLAETRQVTFGS